MCINLSIKCHIVINLSTLIMPKKHKSELSANIARMRTEAGLTQIELARKLGFSHRTVAGWETGGRIPRSGVVEQIARICYNNTPEGLSSHETDDLGRTPNSARGWTISQPVDADANKKNQPMEEETVQRLLKAKDETISSLKKTIGLLEEKINNIEEQTEKKAPVQQKA